MIEGIGNPRTTHPSQSTLTRIDFYWKGNEAEQSCSSKQHNTRQQNLRYGLYHQDTCQQHPTYNRRRELNNRYKSRTHLQWSISPRMLNGMTTFMSSYGSCCYTSASINSFTQIHGFVSRIVVVGKHTRSACHLYIIYTVIVQHLDGHIPASHSVHQRHLGILFKLVLQISLHQVTDESNTDK